MSGKLEVSFNSPQCGWMSIGFDDGVNEFHTTTAHAPHSEALSELLETLVGLLEKDDYSHTLKWNRNPEEFDFVFERKGDATKIEIIEYPTEERESQKSEKVFSYMGDVKQIAEAFRETFQQLYEERNIDEFEDNWHQKFPFEAFEKLSKTIKSKK
jgi:hypothetical protein